MRRAAMLAQVLVLVVLGVIPCARAQEVLTVESKWNEKTVSITKTGVTSFTFDVGGYGSAGGAILGNTYTLNGVDGTTNGATSTVVSTTPANVILFDYNVLSQGSTGQFEIAQTIEMPSPIGTRTGSSNNPFPLAYDFTVPVISTSSEIQYPAGVVFSDSMRAQVQNPVFLFSGLSAKATTTIVVNYGVPHQQ